MKKVQNMQKKLRGVLPSLLIWLELFQKLAADGVLLRLNERVQQLFDRHFDISGGYFVS